jgi:regulatory protein YycH of two-component signal transduction system YycFG
MKILDRSLRVGLFLLICLSVYFTYSIWDSPANKTTDSNKSQTVSNVSTYKKNSDVFLPIRSTWIASGKVYQVNSENVISSLQKKVSQASFGRVTMVADNETNFNKYLDPQDAVEFLYEGSFVLDEYSDIFKLDLNMNKINKGQDVKFSKIQVDFQDKKIRFLDFDKHRVYEANIAIDDTELATIYRNNQAKFIEMAADNKILSKQYQTNGSVKLEKYSYILSSQSYTLYQNAFFKDTDKVRSEDVGENQQYYVSDDESLHLNETDRTVTFDGVPLTSDSELTDIYAQSFAFVRRLGAGIGNVRYFERDNDSIVYRMFVEGYPVFNASNRGAMTVKVSEANSAEKVHITTSMDTIQVPIPSDEEVELESSADMLAQLAAAGADKAKIQSSIIGYTWQDIKETNRLVDLLPEWYVQYDKQWYRLSDLLTELGNTGGQ